MTLGWSRASFLDFSDTQALPALLRCHEHAFHYLGGIPEEILYDRMKRSGFRTTITATRCSILGCSTSPSWRKPPLRLPSSVISP